MTVHVDRTIKILRLVTTFLTHKSLVETYLDLSEKIDFVAGAEQN